jgi:hypothetical protein
MSLKKLEELGLATREEVSKKLIYRPLSPSKLEELLSDKEQELAAARKELRGKLPALLTTFYRNASMPSVQFYEGIDGLRKVYEDHLVSGSDIYFVRTAEEIEDANIGEMQKLYMEKRAEVGIPAHGLAPNYPAEVAWAKKNDKRLKREMTWYDVSQYTAPVEISVYGNSVAFTTFDETIVTAVIDSEQIATAMRDMFLMAQGGAKPKNRLRF